MPLVFFPVSLSLSLHIYLYVMYACVTLQKKKKKEKISTWETVKMHVDWLYICRNNVREGGKGHVERFNTRLCEQPRGTTCRRARCYMYIYTQASPSVFRQTVTRDSVIEQKRGGEGGRGGRAYLSDKRFNEI